MVIKKGVGIGSRAQGSKVTPAEDTGKLRSTFPSEFSVLSTLLDVLFRKRGRPWGFIQILVCLIPITLIQNSNL